MMVIGFLSRGTMFTLILSLAAAVVVKGEDEKAICYTFCGHGSGGLSNTIGFMNRASRYARTQGARFLLPPVRPPGHNLTKTGEFDNLFGPPEWPCVIPPRKIRDICSVRGPGSILPRSGDVAGAPGWSCGLARRNVTRSDVDASTPTVVHEGTWNRIAERIRPLRPHERTWRGPAVAGCEIVVELQNTGLSHFNYREIRSLLREPCRASAPGGGSSLTRWGGALLTLSRLDTGTMRRGRSTTCDRPARCGSRSTTA